MGTIIKILFILIPPSLMALGILLIVQAGEFWLSIISPIKVEPLPLVFISSSPATAIIFMPTSNTIAN